MEQSRFNPDTPPPREGIVDDATAEAAAEVDVEKETKPKKSKPKKGSFFASLKELFEGKPASDEEPEKKQLDKIFSFKTDELQSSERSETQAAPPIDSSSEDLTPQPTEFESTEQQPRFPERILEIGERLVSFVTRAEPTSARGIELPKEERAPYVVSGGSGEAEPPLTETRDDPVELASDTGTVDVLSDAHDTIDGGPSYLTPSQPSENRQPTSDRFIEGAIAGGLTAGLLGRRKRKRQARQYEKRIKSLESEQKAFQADQQATRVRARQRELMQPVLLRGRITVKQPFL